MTFLFHLSGGRKIILYSYIYIYTMMPGQIKSTVVVVYILHIHPAAPLVQQRSRLQCYHNKVGC